MTLEEKLKAIARPKINKAAMEATIRDVQTIVQRQQAEKESRTQPEGFGALWMPRLAFGVASFMGGILISATMFSSVAYSLPGSFFYPIKLVTEKASYVFHPTASGKAELKITFSRQRLNELSQAYDMRGKVDKQVLALLLKDAQDALTLSQGLPVAKQESIHQKLHAINQDTVDCLCRMEKTITGNDANAIKVGREASEKMKNCSMDCCNKK